MIITPSRTDHTAATDHFERALAFYAAHGQEHSAIAQMVAGLLALSGQIARIELATMAGYEC